ncbi:MAG: hypothetical protein ABID61_05585 [Candidatus Micrarchaeota archaeon]
MGPPKQLPKQDTGSDTIWKPIISVEDNDRYIKGRIGGTLRTLTEFAHLYVKKHLPQQKDQKQVTILYPGSGFDLTPLEIGLQILHNSKVDEVNYIYTEIGDLTDFSNKTWHEGFQDLISKIDEKLQPLVKQNLIIKEAVSQKKLSRFYVDTTKGKIEITKREYEYTFGVKVGKKLKKIRLLITYNSFEQRGEITTNEKKEISGKIVYSARKKDWPSNPKKEQVYPTYFRQEQFDKCDIMLSKLCGDFGLLMLDYVRALRKTNIRKQRVILTEHAERLQKRNIEPVVTQQDISTSIGTKYGVSVDLLKNNIYGYCAAFSETCRVGALVIEPKKRIFEK